VSGLVSASYVFIPESARERWDCHKSWLHVVNVSLHHDRSPLALANDQSAAPRVSPCECECVNVRLNMEVIEDENDCGYET